MLSSLSLFIISTGTSFWLMARAKSNRAISSGLPIKTFTASIPVVYSARLRNPRGLASQTKRVRARAFLVPPAMVLSAIQLERIPDRFEMVSVSIPSASSNTTSRLSLRGIAPHVRILLLPISKVPPIKPGTVAFSQFIISPSL